MVKIDRQKNGKYTIAITNGSVTTVKRDLTHQEVIYELEMMPYQKEAVEKNNNG